MTAPHPLCVQLAQLGAESVQAAQAAADLRALEQVRLSYLGRKGSLAAIRKSLGGLSPEERRTVGAETHAAIAALEQALAARQEQLETEVLQQRLAGDRVDITLPGDRFQRGRRHPITQVLDRLLEIFTSLGFDVTVGREIDTDQFNFEALNFPADHPARDMQDTFYINAEVLLRTHTSNLQIHYMLDHTPPFRVVCPGKVYRHDSDMTHLPMFTQIEGFAVDRDIHMGHLKYMLETFIHALFGPAFPLRFRPSFFPFTEPSAEVDMGCVACNGSGRGPGGEACRVCKGSGWLEILGAGMIDPNVLRAVRIDPEQWSGFAFGAGIERIAMLLYGISDIRWLYDNDVRILNQF